MTEAVDSRFRVYSKDGVIQIHGSIGDTTTFSAINEMVGDKNVIDGAGITSASWLGILGLSKHVSELSGETTITNIPYKIYRFLRLLPECGKQYTVDQVEIETFPTGNPGGAAERTVVATSRLQQVYGDGSGDFAELEPGRAISGQVSRLCPTLFEAAVQPPPFANPWFREHQEESFFWYRLLGFWGATLELSLDLVESQSLSLTGLLQRIVTRVKGAEAGFVEAAPLGDSLSTKLVEVDRWISSRCRDIAGRVSEVSRVCKGSLRALQVACGQKAPAAGDKAYSQILGTATAIEALRAHQAEIEEVGFESGQRILGIDAPRALRGALLRIDGTKLDQAAVDRIREGFNIMDPFGDDSWSGTKVEISGEIEQIQADIGNCVVVFQGFDLLKQVLDHRLAEAEIMVAGLAEMRTGTPWGEIKDRVVEQIKKTLVTDQEKFSFAFFLPKEYETYENSDSRAPGDLMLF